MKKYLILLIVFFSCWQGVFAQQRTITGTVRESKETLPGASVFEKNQNNNGASTDTEGRFKITLKGSSEVLIFKCLGYLTKEINVAGKTQITVDLEPDSKGLEEVMVIGYGTQKKITNTGSVSSIKGADIRQTPTSSVQNSLIGRLPGFTSQQRSGRPGADGASFLIRGLSTPNNADPLIIVDDVEFTQPLSELDADQIESISLLKDASTTAVYGVRGANGVMVITTRRGSSGRPEVTFRSEFGIQKPTSMPKYLDSYDAAVLVNQAQLSDGLKPTYTDRDLQLFKDGTDPYGHPNVDWTKTLIKPFSIVARQNLNITGGVDKAKYFISAGYLFQDGLLKNFEHEKSEVNSNNYYKRYNFRSNLDIQATKTLALKLDLSGAFNEVNQPNIGGRNGRNNVFYEISDYNQLAPFAYSPYNPDGSYGANSNSQVTNNIIGRMALGGYNRDYYNDITANLRAVQKLDNLTKGLSIMGNFSYNGRYQFWRSLTRGNNGFPSYIYNSENDTYSPKNNSSRIEKYNLAYGTNGGSSYKRLNYLASLNYDRTFAEDHHVYALALINQTTGTTGASEPQVLRGFTGRVGYDFKQKYLIEFNAGYNGSNRFPKGRRYGLFPAVSGGWNVSEEKFFKNNIKFIDLFKLRASYGLVGSDKVYNNQYIYLQKYNNMDSNNPYSIGEVHNPFLGISEGALGNDNVSWEKEKSSNFGLDMNMFKGKLTFSLDVFQRNRYDILQPRASVPNLIGVALPAANLWRVNNRGYEAQIGYNNTKGNFTYSINGNISVAKNKVLFRDEPAQAYPWLALTGLSMDRILGYTYIGYYTAEDIANPNVAKPSIPTAAGDLKYLDRNGNGVIDPDDRAVLPYSNLPTTIVGLTPSVRYKGFSLTFTLQSAHQFALRGVGETIAPFTNNFRDIHQGAWTPQNQANPTFPRLSTRQTSSNPGNYPSDYWMIRGDYLRLKTIEIGYRLPTSLVERYKLKSARIYANGYNLATWALVDKNIYGLDPENYSGEDGNRLYPQTKIFNLGVQLTF